MRSHDKYFMRFYYFLCGADLAAAGFMISHRRLLEACIFALFSLVMFLSAMAKED